VSASTHSTPQRRSRALPRYRVNPALRATVYQSGQAIFELFRLTGFNHPPQFSSLINAEFIPATRLNIERLYRIADVVGFDRAQLFLGGEQGGAE